MKKAYTRLLWHLKEINKTFSSHPSYYSAKRIMEFILFTNGIILFDWYWFLHRNTMSFEQSCEAFILNMAYAGFMRATLQKEKRLETEPKKEKQTL
jgi:Ca2+/Na+ antiporter